MQNDEESKDESFSSLSRLSSECFDHDLVLNDLNEIDLKSDSIIKEDQQSLSLRATRIFCYFEREAFGGMLRDRTSLFWNSRFRRSAGMTRFLEDRSSFPPRRHAAIELSSKVVDRPERLYATLIHEMCHAAQWVIDNESKPPHGESFRRWASRCLELDPELSVQTRHDYEIEFKYKYECQNCHLVYGRHSASIDIRKRVCGKCRGKLKCLRGDQT